MNSLLLFVGGFHLWFFGVVRPVSTWRDWRRTRDQAPEHQPIVPFYRSAVRDLLGCGLISLQTLAFMWFLSARVQGGGRIFIYDADVERWRDVWSGLMPAAWPGPASWLMGLVALAIMLAIDLPYMRRGRRRGDRHARLASPRTGQERLWWVGLSCAAGICEEITWRGVQPELIAQATGLLWPAIVICTVTFGIGHINQGRAWVAGAGLFGLMFHGLAWLTGSLYVGMAVHVAVNIASGLIGHRESGIWNRLSPHRQSGNR
jgi:membrane protease YdiL (CAAX protease family)